MYTNNYGGDQYIPSVEIDLDNGIYVFSKESATGKTRLYKALVDVKRYNDTITYTYEDIFDKKNIHGLLNDNIRVIFFDRYDMYRNKFTDIICEYCDKSIILIDCKNTEELEVGYDFCEIKMSIDAIKVTKL